MQTDEELIKEFQRSGDRQVLHELTIRHIAKVRSVVSQMVSDESRVDDLTQEVFLRSFRGLPAFNHRSQFSTWLYRVTLNTVYGYIDRNGRSPVEFHAELPETAETGTDSPGDAVMRSELADRVDSAMNLLSPSLRAAIVLTSIQGHGVAEAARIAGCNVGTMYWRVHKARKLLQRQLAKYLRP